MAGNPWHTMACSRGRRMATPGNDRPLQGPLLPHPAMGFTVLWVHREIQLILRLMGARTEERQEGEAMTRQGSHAHPQARGNHTGTLGGLSQQKPLTHGRQNTRNKAKVSHKKKELKGLESLMCLSSV